MVDTLLWDRNDESRATEVARRYEVGMNDPRRSEWSDPTRPAGNSYPSGNQPGYPPGYPPNVDPAYAGQQYGPTYYGPGYPPTASPPTEPLPPYWQQGAGPSQGYGPVGGYAEPPEPPQGPKSPRWLWVLAGAAILLVVGLVIALIIVTGSTKESTVVAPLPPLPGTSSTPSTTSTTTRTPTRTRPGPMPSTTSPTSPSTPSETTNPTATDAVVYNVTGDGRAINITYVDTGGVMQTEFNVTLPWTKQVDLASPARNSASIAVVNVGRDVTCTVSINGVQVRERSGRGLTICTGVA